MKTTLLTFILGLLFLTIPLFFAYALHISWWTRIGKTVLRTLAGAAVMYGLLYFLFQHDSIALNIVFTILMLLTSALFAVLKARVSLKTGFIPMLTGMTAALVTVCTCVLLLIAGNGLMLHTRFLVPVIALMTGSITLPCARAMATYYTGLRKHGQLYTYLLGNGATHTEALQHFVRRAMEKALLPGTDRMAATIIGLSPFILWTALLCGTDVLSAIVLQVVLLSATYCATVVAAYVAVRTAQWYGRDGYSRLKTH